MECIEEHCRRAALSARDRCVFHLRRRTPDENKTFIRALKRYLKQEKYDFQGFCFPGKAKEMFEAHGEFRHEVFLNDAQFPPGMSFKQVIFEKVSFQNSTFKGNAFFTGAVFKKEANFKNVTFEDGETCFNAAHFVNAALFDYATFNGAASFGQCLDMKGQFRGRTSFDHVCFNNEAVFEKRGFRKGMDFTYVMVAQSHAVRFQHCNLSKASFLETDLARLDFNGVRWAQAPIVPDRARLAKKLSAYQRTLKAAKTSGRRLPNKAPASKAITAFIAEIGLRIIRAARVPRGRNRLDDEVRFCAEIRKLPSPQRRQRLMEIGRLYRQLKLNYEEGRDHPSAGDWHFGEMEMRRLSLARSSPMRGLFFLYRKLSGYGERPRRAIIGWFAFLFLFSVLNCFLGFRVLSEQQVVPVAHAVNVQSQGSVVKTERAILRIVDYDVVWKLPKPRIRSKSGANKDFLADLSMSLIATIRLFTLQRFIEVQPVRAIVGSFAVGFGAIFGSIQAALVALSVKRYFRR